MTTDNSVSFYFFDFDDNTMFLTTPIFVKNEQTRELKEVSTTDFAEIRQQLGKPGEWEDFGYFEGTYGHFRDIPQDQLQPGQKQWFVQDIEKALEEPPEKWQAPSWEKYLDKRFFVIDTHEGEKVKLVVFPVDNPVTGKADRGEHVG